MQKYERGDTMKILGYFTDPDTGVYVDPSDPTCYVYKPDGTVKWSGAMTKIGTGSYKAEVSTDFTDDLGYWKVRIYGTYTGKRVVETERLWMVEVI